MVDFLKFLRRSPESNGNGNGNGESRDIVPMISPERAERVAARRNVHAVFEHNQAETRYAEARATLRGYGMNPNLARPFPGTTAGGSSSTSINLPSKSPMEWLLPMIVGGALGMGGYGLSQGLMPWQKDLPHPQTQQPITQPMPLPVTPATAEPKFQAEISTDGGKTWKPVPIMRDN